MTEGKDSPVPQEWLGLLRIIRKLWSSVYDLLFFIEGRDGKTLTQIQDDLDVVEMMCRPYADIDEGWRFDAEGRKGGEEGW